MLFKILLSDFLLELREDCYDCPSYNLNCDVKTSVELIDVILFEWKVTVTCYITLEVHSVYISWSKGYRLTGRGLELL